MTAPQRMRIVTRTSALAMWQATFVQAQLLQHYPQMEVEIIGVKTSGDISQERNIPINKIGGKAVFVKELEQALLANEADIAVHSLKDVPSEFPQGLGLTAICQRASPFDAWICRTGHSLETIPRGAVVGTSSLRRLVQLKQLRNDLSYQPIRGNVDTRVRKCFDGEFDAIVLAEAGLTRLNLQKHILQVFTADQLLPAVGQGALAIECRLDDEQTRSLLTVLDDAPTRLCIEAERAMNAVLGGNCQVPIAGFAQIINNVLVMQGRVGHPERNHLLEAQAEGLPEQASQIGELVAEDLIEQGAKNMIEDIIGCG